jgi:hypothetical protein
MLTDEQLDSLTSEVNAIQTVEKLREVYASHKPYLAQTLIDGTTLDSLFKTRASFLAPVREEATNGN